MFCGSLVPSILAETARLDTLSTWESLLEQWPVQGQSRPIHKTLLPIDARSWAHRFPQAIWPAGTESKQIRIAELYKLDLQQHPHEGSSSVAPAHTRNTQTLHYLGKQLLHLSPELAKLLDNGRDFCPFTATVTHLIRSNDFCPHVCMFTHGWYCYKIYIYYIYINLIYIAIW